MAGKIELIVRDTQSDPTKAVNAAAELTQRDHVHVVWGPLNSGEALAATPLIARTGVPMLDPCWVDSLTDVKKYPLAFRNAPTNQQIGGAANHYVIDVLKLNKVAVDRRHHRLRHRFGGSLCADAEGERCGGRLSGRRRCQQPRPEAGAAAHAQCRRRR